MPKKNLIVALVLYVVSASLSFAAFSYLSKDSLANSVANKQAEDPSQTLLSSLLDIDPNEAKDQVCPLNGAYYTQTEKTAWEQRRPLFVMIENTPDSRPQAGLSRADVVFEAVAEGGVTRFGALFYCAAQYQDLTLAPIRSARTYFVDWASGFNLPMYVHVGGANVSGPTDALGQIGDYGWEGENDINQFSVGYPTFVRNYNRIPGKEIATEHTMETTTEGLWEVAADRDWTNLTPARTVAKKAVPAASWQSAYKSWTFESDKVPAGSVSKVSYDFWTGYNDYSVEWNYDSATDSYKRVNAGEAFTDINNDEQVASKTMIVLLTTEKGPINEKKHMLYGTTGRGSALIFKHGQAPIEANWVKADRESELEFVDVRGKAVELARGQVWISVLATGSEVVY
ncbi:MAG: hypothetical protein UT13_C0001G0436 [Candidatus Pacebacteria bacterium GW2011_GWF2_38_9]|nr:MAG: hypothetical protein US01_C0001G0448 [candidate division TM6 bacterium GW2011_GWF2_28_16]KKQ88789.1 MAG: hypothetical protein UT13_C0001G0436 [Candidatus Pacebacteria bacterium GW2011_GWF2_38_9]HAZ73271.1 hypothetical protein [Candidatus Paceibacterota bacterium]